MLLIWDETQQLKSVNMNCIFVMGTLKWKLAHITINLFLYYTFYNVLCIDEHLVCDLSSSVVFLV